MLNQVVSTGDKVVHVYRYGSYMGASIGAVIDTNEETGEVMIKREVADPSWPRPTISRWIKSYNCVKV